MPFLFSSKTRLAELVVLPIIWAALVYGATQLRSVGGDKHSLCGPWGCGPSTSALVTMHLGWLALIGPPLLYFPYRLPLSRRALVRLTWLLIAIGTIGVVAIVAWQWFVWLPQAKEWSRPYIWRRCGFAIANAVDVPLVQLILIGVFLRLSMKFSALFQSRPTEASTN
jgi:hypothetical protein